MPLIYAGRDPFRTVQQNEHALVPCTRIQLFIYETVPATDMRRAKCLHCLSV